MYVRDIIAATARAGDITVPALLSMDRRKGVAHLRHAGILVSRRLTRQSLPSIGRYWGHRDHTTVLNSLKRAEELIADGDPGMNETIQKILARLGVSELPGKEEIVLSSAAILRLEVAEAVADFAALERRLADLRFQLNQLQEQPQ